MQVTVCPPSVTCDNGHVKTCPIRPQLGDYWDGVNHVTDPTTVINMSTEANVKEESYSIDGLIDKAVVIHFWDATSNTYSTLNKTQYAELLKQGSSASIIKIVDKKAGKVRLEGVSNTDIATVTLDGKAITTNNMPEGVEFNVGFTQAELVEPIHIVLTHKQGNAVLNTYYPFADVKLEQWYTPAVIQLWKLDIIEGFNDGTFGIGKTLTRAELLKLILLVSGQSAFNKIDTPFSDVDNSHWASGYINYALEKTIIVANANFYPNDNINRAETAKMVNKTFALSGNVFSQFLLWIKKDTVCEEGVFTDLEKGAWYCEHIQQVYQKNLMKGRDNSFKPQDKLSREEGPVVMCRAYFYKNAGNMSVCEQ